MSLLQNSNAISTGGGYNLTDSLRFRSSASSYLSWTPASAGNRKTWTWSGWVKRGNLGATQYLFGANVGTSIDGGVVLSGTDNIGLSISGNVYNKYTSAVFRDTSAWYHIVVALDTDNATAADRIKLYVNGVEQTSYFTQNSGLPPSGYTPAYLNNANNHDIGKLAGYSQNYFDGYMTEVNLIDGQALTPSDFGETDETTGVWQPIEYTGTYGTNGFYLPMKETTQAEGFNTVLYTGTGASQSISNVGFSPDWVWIKPRNSASSHEVYDSVRGATKYLSTNQTIAEISNVHGVDSFDFDGFTVGSATSISARTYVAWCWDAGSGLPVTNNDGTNTTTIKANPAKGFSIVTYAGNGSNTTGGHGLGAVPAMVIYKNRTYSPGVGWPVYHQSLGVSQYLNLELSGAALTATNLFQGMTSSVITLPPYLSTNQTGDDYVAYVFAEVAGYSKISSYTGTGASGNTVTTGFRPAMVMYKRTDAAGYAWQIRDNTRDASGNTELELYPNLANADNKSTRFIQFTDTGFTVNDSNASINASGGTYIYMAFADTRDYQWNFDASGNKNNWTGNNINSNASSDTTYDIMSDVPTLTDEDTANYATLNPLDRASGGILSEANLSYNHNSSFSPIRATMAVSSGKWYWEVHASGTGSSNAEHGLALASANINGAYATYNFARISFYNGNKRIGNGSLTTYDTSGAASSGDIYGFAADLDNGTLTVYRNNVSKGTLHSWTPNGTLYAPHMDYSTTSSGADKYNFGQRPFVYTPPTGYKKLNTYNLPDSSIKDGSKYFNTITWTGDGASSRSFTGVGFEPDFVWSKQRNIAQTHANTDSVRGVGKRIATDTTAIESTSTVYGQLTAFDSDGFTATKGSDPTYSYWNILNGTYVAWNWRASDSAAVSNTDGTSINPVLVSANTTAGVSIVTYDPNPSGTIGHGLGTAPELIIEKKRDTTGDWLVGTTVIDGSYDYLRLNTTAAAAASAVAAPTATVFTPNLGGDSAVAYCFTSVEGFSKIGTYTGNASTDGPFVYTGFRPAWILEKNATNGSYGWLMWDSTRATYNMVTKFLVANTSGAEVDTGGGLGPNIDILSNGFKIRDANPGWNQSGATLLYMAFAENPFKNSLAR